MTVNVKIVVMEHLWCDFVVVVNTKWGEGARMNMSKITRKD